MHISVTSNFLKNRPGQFCFFGGMNFGEVPITKLQPVAAGGGYRYFFKSTTIFIAPYEFSVIICAFEIY